MATVTEAAEIEAAGTEAPMTGNAAKTVVRTAQLHWSFNELQWINANRLIQKMTVYVVKMEINVYAQD